MRWIDDVHCTPCQGTTDWVVDKGQWTCHHCGHVVTAQEIKAMQNRADLAK